MAEKQRSTEQASDSRQSSGTRNGRYDSGKTLSLIHISKEPVLIFINLTVMFILSLIPLL